MNSGPGWHFDTEPVEDPTPWHMPRRPGWFVDAEVDWLDWSFGVTVDVGRSGFSLYLWLGPVHVGAGIEVGSTWEVGDE